MADITKAKNFLLTTDFPLDKIIYLTTGSFSIGAYPSAAGTATIAHGLPFTPLANMVWSTTADFSISYMSGSGSNATDIFLNNFGVTGSVVANGTNVVVTGNNFTASPVTFYYRVYAFEPSNSSADLTPTANSSDPFILNTDYNYTKLYLEGILNLGISTTVTHNLGYIPQVEVWAQSVSQINPPQQNNNVLDTTAGTVIGTFGFIVTTTTLQFVDIGSSTFLHYRIYLDE